MHTLYFPFYSCPPGFDRCDGCLDCSPPDLGVGRGWFTAGCLLCVGRVFCPGLPDGRGVAGGRSRVGCCTAGCRPDSGGLVTGRVTSGRVTCPPPVDGLVLSGTVTPPEPVDGLPVFGLPLLSFPVPGLVTEGLPDELSPGAGLLSGTVTPPEPVDGLPVFGLPLSLCPAPGLVTAGLPDALSPVEGLPVDGRVTGLKTLSRVETTYFRSRYKLLLLLPGLL